MKISSALKGLIISVVLSMCSVSFKISRGVSSNTRPIQKEVLVTHIQQASEPQYGEQGVHVALAGEVQSRAHVAARARHAVTVPAHTNVVLIPF